MGYNTSIQIWRWENTPELEKLFVEQIVEEASFEKPIWVISVEETLNDSPVIDRLIEAFAKNNTTELRWDDKVEVVRTLKDDFLYLVFSKAIR